MRVSITGHQFSAEGELMSAGVSETGPYAIVALDHGAVVVYPLSGGGHKCATYSLTRVDAFKQWWATVDHRERFGGVSISAAREIWQAATGKTPEVGQ